MSKRHSLHSVLGFAVLASTTVSAGLVSAVTADLIQTGEYIVTCGNSIVDNGEKCDDGNTASSDGCSSVCLPEVGFVCEGRPKSICTIACGNGVVNNGEKCDDGNTVSGDGCSSVCMPEYGYICEGKTWSSCKISCGNGVVNNGEYCDDGNSVNGDGCDAACVPESGYVCDGRPKSICVQKDTQWQDFQRKLEEERKKKNLEIEEMKKKMMQEEEWKKQNQSSSEQQARPLPPCLTKEMRMKIEVLKTADNGSHASEAAALAAIAPCNEEWKQMPTDSNSSVPSEEMRRKMDEMQRMLIEMKKKQQMQQHSAASEESTTPPIQYTEPTIEPTIPTAGFEEPISDITVTAKEWFSDISRSEAIGAAANDLADRGIVGGFSDGTFRPNQTVNRAELAKFLLLARYKAIPDQQNDGSLSDVKTGEWYMKFVMAAKSVGIISGYQDGTFRPGKTVNTAEFLKMLTRTFGLETNLAHDYTDVSSNAWFAEFAGVAQQYKLFPERGTELQPERQMTRGEVVYAIEQILLAQ